MTKHEQAVEMLNQLEDIMIKVEVYEQFSKKDWIALARVAYFLLKDYAVKTDKTKGSDK